MITPVVPRAEKEVVRDLARRVADIAASQGMADRRERWKQHTSMNSSRPVVFINPQGAWVELLPEDRLQCRHDITRNLERVFRRQIYQWEHFTSDNAFEARVVVEPTVRSSGWGLEKKWHRSGHDRGAGGFDPVLVTPSDVDRLRVPRMEFDRDATRRDVETSQDLVDGLLPVVVKGNFPGSYHLMNQYTGWRGLDQALVDMADNPGLIHEAMTFLEDAHTRVLQQYIEQGLLALNNDDTIIYTAGYGYSDELPRPGYDPAEVTPADLWCWAEAQEMAVVSPDMHREFAFDYEKRLLAPFGLTGYGCCEDLSRKLDFVLTIPRLRRVSICPWSDVEACARQLQDKAIFMWKPQPSYLAGGFDPDIIRACIRRTVDAAREHGCTLEMALLDTHTCDRHPERFDIWSQIAMQEAERY